MFVDRPSPQAAAELGVYQQIGFGEEGPAACPAPPSICFVSYDPSFDAAIEFLYIIKNFRFFLQFYGNDLIYKKDNELVSRN